MPRSNLLLTEHSIQGKLTSGERFSIALGRTTFYTSQPSQPEKGLGIEPLFGALAPEMRNKEIDFSPYSVTGNRYIEVG